jgi:hypothetical protein
MLEGLGLKEVDGAGQFRYGFRPSVMHLDGHRLTGLEGLLHHAVSVDEAHVQDLDLARTEALARSGASRVLFAAMDLLQVFDHHLVGISEFFIVPSSTQMAWVQRFRMASRLCDTMTMVRPCSWNSAIRS